MTISQNKQRKQNNKTLGDKVFISGTGYISLLRKSGQKDKEEFETKITEDYYIIVHSELCTPVILAHRMMLPIVGWLLLHKLATETFPIDVPSGQS